MQIGDELELTGDQFYDLHAGATLVQIARRNDRVTGYLTLQSFIAETIPLAVPDNSYPPLTASIDGRLIMVPYPTGSDSAPSIIRKIADASLAKAFSTPLTNGQVHPVMAGNHLLLMLVALLTGEPDAALRETALTAARRVFDEYVFPAKIAVRPDRSNLGLQHSHLARRSRHAAQLAYGLVNKADLCTTADNRIQNTRYEGLINTESYTAP